MRDDFLQRFADRVELHKWIDSKPEGAQFLVLVREPGEEGTNTFHSLGDITLETALFLCAAFTHWSLCVGTEREPGA